MYFWLGYLLIGLYTAYRVAATCVNDPDYGPENGVWKGSDVAILLLVVFPVTTVTWPVAWVIRSGIYIQKRILKNDLYGALQTVFRGDWKVRTKEEKQILAEQRVAELRSKRSELAS